MQTDVLIVGAGPTGLALATQMIRLGIDFIIIDRAEGTTPYSKAIGVQARTLEIYEQIGIADSLIEKGWKANRVRLLESGKIRGGLDLTDIGKGLSPYPFVLIVEQGEHERILNDYIKSHGAAVRWRTELKSFSHDDRGAVAKLTNELGREETIEAKYLVGCDGASSIARHTLGIAFEGSTFERLFYVADVQIDWEFPHDALHVNLGKDNLTAFFPMPGDRRWRIVGTFPEGHTKDEGEILYDEIEQQIIKDTAITLDISHVNWFSVYKVHSRAVSQFSNGRCFLAGDAAHIHTPAGAQGMNTGIQDGYNIAWKLAEVLNNGAADKLLDTYNEERLPNAKRLLQTTDRFFQAAASEDRLISFLRLHVFPHVAGFAFDLDVVKRAVFPLVSQIGINYRESALSLTDGPFKVRAGDRMPYFEVDGESIYSKLRDAKFHSLRFHDGVQPADDATGVQTLPLYPNIASIFGSEESFTVVLRPDNYIGMLYKGTDLGRADEYMRDRIGRPL
jgi:2-polyprenyl-6-methoxyphenol hydroxylase-like FAD-dependent oxidoreductase